MSTDSFLENRGLDLLRLNFTLYDFCIIAAFRKSKEQHISPGLLLFHTRARNREERQSASSLTFVLPSYQHVTLRLPMKRTL